MGRSVRTYYCRFPYCEYTLNIVEVTRSLTASCQIADPDRKISTLYDMLDEQDATNRDAKGLPFTVRSFKFM